MGDRDIPIGDPALVRRMKAEIRREMELAEEQGRTLAARQATLREVLALCVQRGDRLVVTCGAVHYRGIARHVRDDLMSLEGTAALIECQLSVIDEIGMDDETPAAGSSIVREAESFRARMGLVELAGETVEVVTAGGTRVGGRIEAVARDHLVLIGPRAHRSLVPLGRVAFVVRPLR